ncbi:GNAT family N-acetyltransferase (plasmid) [Amycolatopsis sp. AA4]|nr:GNAT family N-acetyltransferase [Amycolatopsis sp. AA4]
MSGNASKLTERKLIKGSTTRAPGVVIRLAGADDVAAVERMAPVAGTTLGEVLAEAIRSGAMGSAHRAALAAGGGDRGREAFTHAIARAAAEHDQFHAYAVAAVVLVAAHRDHGVVGAEIVFPPVHVAENYVTYARNAGANSREQGKLLAVGAVGLAKVSALVVDESHRGRGLGAALLGQARRIFFAHGYPLVYGQIPADRPDLAGFYQCQGFEVRRPEDRLDLETVFGIPGGIRPDRGERFFVCWNPHL